MSSDILLILERSDSISVLIFPYFSVILAFKFSNSVLAVANCSAMDCSDEEPPTLATGATGGRTGTTGVATS